jgi:hypothetical protein
LGTEFAVDRGGVNDGAMEDGATVRRESKSYGIEHRLVTAVNAAQGRDAADGDQSAVDIGRALAPEPCRMLRR